MSQVFGSYFTCCISFSQDQVCSQLQKYDPGIFIKLGNIDKKTCHTQLVLDVKGVGALGESLKKGKFVTKFFFEIMLNEVSKRCKK